MTAAKFYGNLFSGLIGANLGMVLCGLYLHIAPLVGFPAMFGVAFCFFRALIAHESGE